MLVENNRKIMELLKFLLLFILAVFIVPCLNVLFAFFIGKQELISKNILDVIILLSAFAFILFIEKQNPFSYLKLTTNVIRGVLVGIAAGIFLVAFSFFKSHFSGSGEIVIPENWFFTILLVGMLQEVPFRGLLQKKLTEHWGGPVAILATSVLFVIYHFSRWFFIVDPVQCLYIFIASLVFGFVFLKTDSLWATIILHAVNNFVSLAIR